MTASIIKRQRRRNSRLVEDRIVRYPGATLPPAGASRRVDAFRILAQMATIWLGNQQLVNNLGANL